MTIVVSFLDEIKIDAVERGAAKHAPASPQLKQSI
jgi:hypothetical protein